MNMKHYFFSLLILSSLCCCFTQQRKKLPHYDTLDSISCYNVAQKRTIVIKDTIVLNMINRIINNSVIHNEDYLVKFPPFYGTITLFSNNSSIKLEILGDVLRIDKDTFLDSKVQFDSILDSIVFDKVYLNDSNYIEK